MDIISLTKPQELCSEDTREAAEQFISSATYIGRDDRPGRLRGSVRTVVNGASLNAQMYTNEAMRAAVTYALSNKRYDVMHVATSWLMPNTPPSAAPPIVLEEMAIEFIGLHRHAQNTRNPLFRSIRSVEARKEGTEAVAAWRQAQVVVVVSEPEEQFVRKAIPNKPTVIVPNGVGHEFHEFTTDEAPEPTLVFAGNYRYYPNVEAATTLATRILPALRREFPTTRLILVGAYPPSAVSNLNRLPGVLVTGFVEDYRPLLGAAWVVAAPLTSGAGTRLKVLEAMALGKTVVATPLAASGLDVTDGNHVLVQASVDEFPAAISYLLRNRAVRTHIGANARRRVVAQYSWDRAAKSLYDAYEYAQKLGITR